MPRALRPFQADSLLFEFLDGAESLFHAPREFASNVDGITAALLRRAIAGPVIAARSLAPDALVFFRAGPSGASAFAASATGPSWCLPSDVVLDLPFGRSVSLEAIVAAEVDGSGAPQEETGETKEKRGLMAAGAGLGAVMREFILKGVGAAIGAAGAGGEGSGGRGAEVFAKLIK